MSSAEISVIVVNYGTADLAISAVESVLQRSHAGRSVEIHLVDNASPGEDARQLQAAHQERGWSDRVTLYIEATNHGFGRGNNLVLRALAGRPTPPKYVLLLNPDARLKTEAIATLADFLDSHPDIGMAGPRIETPDGLPTTAAFRFPNIICEFEKALCFGPASRILRPWQVPLPADLPAGPVDWVSGAALMARFDTLRDLGFFDPAFFLYFEEVDLMYRAARKGWKTWYVPQAEVIHAEAASTNMQTGIPGRRRFRSYWYASWHHYFRKNHGRARTMLTGLAWMTGASLNFLLARLRRRPPDSALHLYHDFWAMVGRPLVGLQAQRYD